MADPNDELIAALSAGGGPPGAMDSPPASAPPPTGPAPPSLITGTGGQSQFDYKPDPLLGAAREQGLIHVPSPPSMQETKGDFFKRMLSNFLYSFAQGASQGGTGPGSNLRAFGAAYLAPFERDIQNKKMQMEQQRQASQDALRQAQEQQAFANSQMIPVTVNGQTMMLPASAAHQILAVQAGNVSKEKIAGENIQSKEKVAGQGIVSKEKIAAGNLAAKHPSDPLWQITKQTNPGLDPNSPEFAQKWEDLRMKERTDPGVKRMATLMQRSFHPFNDAAGNTVGWVNPITRQVTLGQDIPGLQGVLAASGGVIPPKPPAQVVGMAIAAGTMLQHMPTINKEIDQAAASDKLGPGAGRWNEFMTGNVGRSDPQFTKLRTDISLLQTRLMQAHVGLSGSDKMMEHFKNLIDQGYQSPENMKAAMETIQSYLETYRGMSPNATGGTPKATWKYSSSNPFAK